MSTTDSSDRDFEISGSQGSASSRSSSVCSCQNQLAHYDWGGRLRPNLPRRCQPHLLSATIGAGKKLVQLFVVAITNYLPEFIPATEEGRSLTAIVSRPEKEVTPINPNESSKREDESDCRTSKKSEVSYVHTKVSFKLTDCQYAASIVSRPEKEATPMNPNESSKRKREDESDCCTCKKSKVSYVHTKASFKLTDCQYAASISIDIKFSSAAKKSSVKISVMMDREKK
jgi:hypothetical protein